MHHLPGHIDFPELLSADPFHVPIQQRDVRAVVALCGSSLYLAEEPGLPPELTRVGCIPKWDKLSGFETDGFRVFRLEIDSFARI